MEAISGTTSRRERLIGIAIGTLSAVFTSFVILPIVEKALSRDIKLLLMVTVPIVATLAGIALLIAKARHGT